MGKYLRRYDLSTGVPSFEEPEAEAAAVSEDKEEEAHPVASPETGANSWLDRHSTHVMPWLHRVTGR